MSNIVRKSYQQKHDIAPHKKQRSYLRQYMRLPLHRKEIIKKIKIGDSTFQQNIKQELVQTTRNGSKSWRKHIVPVKTPRILPTLGSNLNLSQTKQQEITSLKALKNSFAAKSFRASTQIKQDSDKNISQIKNMIDRIVSNNKNKRMMTQNNNNFIKTQNEPLTTTDLKATQHYYSIKRYYEKKYTSH